MRIKNILIYIVVIFSLGVPFIFLLNNLSFSNYFSCKQSEQPIPLLNGAITQSFTLRKTNLKYISFKPATYTKNINGIIVFRIKDSFDTPLFEKEINTLKLEDNMFYEIEIPKNILKNNQEYSMELNYIKTPETPLGFWNTKNDCYAGALSVDSKEVINSDLVLYFKFSEKNIISNATILLDRISQYKPLFLKNSSFLLLIISYMLLITIFLLTILRIFI